MDSVDLTKSPPVLTIGGQNFTVDKIKRVVRPAPDRTLSGLPVTPPRRRGFRRSGVRAPRRHLFPFCLPCLAKF